MIDLFNKYTNDKGHVVLANDKVFNLFYKSKGYKPLGQDTEEYTRKEYMEMLDNLKVEYRQNDRLDTLKGLYEENKGE